MDSRYFDDLAKSLAGETSRRRMLKGLGGIAVGSLGFLGAAKAGSAQDAAGGDDRCNTRRERRCVRRCRRRGGGDCRDRCCDD